MGLTISKIESPSTHVPWHETLRKTKMIDILKRIMEISLAQERRYIICHFEAYAAEQQERVQCPAKSMSIIMDALFHDTFYPCDILPILSSPKPPSP